MSWNGLDTAGVEQLWDDDLIQKTLLLIGKYDRFDKYDFDSSIYNDLEDFFPNTTWRNVNSDGSKRPIFRKADPFRKLGLTNSTGTVVELSDLGIELNSGNITLQDVYILTCKAFVESDGSRSFALMSRAALWFPNHQFTLNEVEFAVSQFRGSDPKSLAKEIERVQSQNLTIPAGSRRKRILTRFMKTLVSAGALHETQLGFVAANSKILEEISGKTPEQPFKAPQLTSRNGFNLSVVDPENRAPIVIDMSDPTHSDPRNRLAMLEKAHSAHEEILKNVANEIKIFGREPLEDRNSFDVAFLGQKSAIIEVKSTNPKNAISQLRKASAQLPEYRWFGKSLFGNNTKLYIATSDNIFRDAGEDYIDFIEKDRDMKVISLTSAGLVDRSGKSFQEILNLHH